MSSRESVTNEVSYITADIILIVKSDDPIATTLPLGCHDTAITLDLFFAILADYHQSLLSS